MRRRDGTSGRTRPSGWGEGASYASPSPGVTDTIPQPAWTAEAPIQPVGPTAPRNSETPTFYSAPSGPTAPRDADSPTFYAAPPGPAGVDPTVDAEIPAFYEAPQAPQPRDVPAPRYTDVPRRIAQGQATDRGVAPGTCPQGQEWNITRMVCEPVVRQVTRQLPPQQPQQEPVPLGAKLVLAAGVVAVGYVIVRAMMKEK